MRNRSAKVIKIPKNDVKQCRIKLNPAREINTGFELRVSQVKVASGWLFDVERVAYQIF
jgi:hypothetical protein